MPATTIGKRKREPPPPRNEKGEGEESGNRSELRALLQRHFETRFKPLDTAFSQPVDKYAEEEDEDDDEMLSDASGSEWGGFSGDEGGDDEAPAVEVVDYTAPLPDALTSTMSRKELKAYLSTRPPSHTTAETAAPSKKPAGDDAPEDSAALLANDLALQRLIAESHILSAAGGNASHYLSNAAAATNANTQAFADGRIRRKTTDMRVQALGARDSVLAQAKMPMSMRKGIIKSTETREEKRRREGRENGIILERAAKQKDRGKPKRRSERAVDLPAVGKMRGAELRISSREIRAIEAEGKRGGREKGGRRRRR